jgi:phenylalanyl-tRNA synthetase beta chain
LSLRVPPYRVDVKREADVIEEILRIYGYNNVEIPVQVRSSIQTSERPDPQRIRNLVSEMLTSAGFNEIWSNSLTKASYYENSTVFNSSRTVKLFNPLSNDLAAMRQTLLYGGLECIAYNANRQNPNLRLYEFGNCYFDKGTNIADHPADNFEEEEHLALFITGKKEQTNWVSPEAESSFYQVKSFSENVFKRLGLSNRKLQVEAVAGGIFSDGLEYKSQNGKSLMQVGVVHPSFLKRFGIENPVYYADINWWLVLAETRKNKVAFEELPKYPEVRRDLALLIDTAATFGQISQVAYKTERQLLRDVNLFDVYEGQGIPEGKKSYAVSFILRDDERTLNEKQIDKVMEKLVAAYDRELGAKLR